MGDGVKLKFVEGIGGPTVGICRVQLGLARSDDRWVEVEMLCCRLALFFLGCFLATLSSGSMSVLELSYT